MGKLKFLFYKWFKILLIESQFTRLVGVQHAKPWQNKALKHIKSLNFSGFDYRFSKIIWYQVKFVLIFLIQYSYPPLVHESKGGF